MSVFYWIGWLAYVVQICFGILCLAAGLYYVAETIEEYTSSSKKTMHYMTCSVIIILTLLWVIDGLPITMYLSGLVANIFYLCLLQAFPFIQFSSPSFILSVLAFCLKHYVSLNYFANNYVPYTEIVGYFTICCWVVPFTLLISTSASENALPMHGGGGSQPNDVLSHYYSQGKKKKSSFLGLLDGVREKLIPNRGDKHLY